MEFIDKICRSMKMCRLFFQKNLEICLSYKDKIINQYKNNIEDLNV